MVISLETKKNVQEHFNLASSYYKDLWGVHIHHGYYLTGKESKEFAQENLLKLVAEKLQIKPKSSVLDIGCGIGGTTIFLAKNYGCDVTGFTVAPNQVEMAIQNAKDNNVKGKFYVDDADDMQTKGKFDYAIAIEVLSHLHDRDNFFKKLNTILKPKGRIAICAWQRDVVLSDKEVKKFIEPIEFGMMVSLPSPQTYFDLFHKYGFRLVSYSDLNEKVAKTWDVGIDLIRKPALWKLAKEHREHFINFLKAFASMRNGYKSGAFRYGLIIAEKK